jgi:hypothetical protein
VLFTAAMVCHGELAKDRPSTEHLTGFYLWLSLGGALGGVFNAIIAPLAFRSVIEYPLVIALGLRARACTPTGPGEPSRARAGLRAARSRSASCRCWWS